MAFYLRYTEKPIEDLLRGVSYHASGMSVEDTTIENVTSLFDCDEECIVELDWGVYSKGKADGNICYFQELNGLCGFELEAETLEDAIEEANEFEYNSAYESSNTNWAIFEGEYAGDCPEGELFSPVAVLYDNNDDEIIIEVTTSQLSKIQRVIVKCNLSPEWTQKAIRGYKYKITPKSEIDTAIIESILSTDFRKVKYSDFKKTNLNK